jgi:hypothetical protein
MGQCIAYIDSYAAPISGGVTPTTDVGAVDNAVVSINRDLLTLEQGTPLLTIEQWSIRDAGTLTLNGWEWNQENFYKVLGAGTTSTGGLGGTEIIYDFGSDFQVNPLQIRLEHVMPSGATINMDFWRVGPPGALDFNFNKEDFNKFDYTFNLWRGLADWTATDLGAGTRVFRYRRQPPP